MLQTRFNPTFIRHMPFFSNMACSDPPPSFGISTGSCFVPFTLQLTLLTRLLLTMLAYLSRTLLIWWLDALVFLFIILGNTSTLKFHPHHFTIEHAYKIIIDKAGTSTHLPASVGSWV